MRFTLYGYGKYFRLKGFSERLDLSRTARRPAEFPTRPRRPLSFGQSLTMHSRRHATASRHSEGGTDRVEVFGTVPPSADGTGPPAEKGSGAMSPKPGAHLEEDSEAESFKDGRSEEVDLETRSRAFAWCRDFLSGSWKTLDEEDFQISIVR